MSNADLFSLLKTYMDTRLSGIETSFTDTTHTLEKKPATPRTKKKIRAADTRAVKKLKSVKSADKKQNVRKRPAEASGSTSQTAHNAIPVSVSMPPFSGADLVTETRSKGPGKEICVFRCGLFGHWASDCKKDTKTGFELPEELRKDFSAHTDTFTDASDTGAAGFIQNSTKILHKMWLETERGRSSTWREKISSTGFWKNDTQVKHTELKILFRKMKNSVIDSKARNTTVKYAYSFKRFVVWSEKYTEIKSVLPANEIYVSLYLQYLMQSAKHYSTIEAACYAIKWAHSLAGFEDPCASDIVKCIVEASKRKLKGLFRKRTDECKHHAQSF
ncbi:unnamed protein product [Mytilus coruscus]|uniref:CCHC-type domain-containing protein n=1 Tax=Mytilus coruscus TaxID=42192 RepID=A0A6J8B3K5_MYTCO|nr:unnamed protein product [Mytilus coruscus]